MNQIAPIELNPDKRGIPAPISLAPAREKRRRRKRPAVAAVVLCAATALGLLSWLQSLIAPEAAVLCHPTVQFQGGTLEFKLYADSSAERLSCGFSGSDYPFYETGAGQFRALVPVKLFARPVLHYAVIREKSWLGQRVIARVPVAVRRGRYPHIKINIHPPRGQNKADREQLLVSARQILLLTLARRDAAQYWRGHFIYPLRGRISAPYGERRTVNGKPGGVHYGLDIAAPAGTAVVAANTGLVALTGNFPLQGKLVLLSHGQGLFTAYLHLSEVLAREGTIIQQGQPLGKTGSTGRSTGPHLHWGVYLHGVPVNPPEWLDRIF